MDAQSSGRHDLVGGPFAVIESDPGVFTTLIRKLGVRGLEVTELYSVEPFATDHLNPYGLIFCYLCEDGIGAQNDSGSSDDLEDPDARTIWFANQLSDDACSSQAILNVLFNCKGVDIGVELREFAADTEKMSPVMRGLAISNSSHIREAQNSLARPADVRGAYHTLAATSLDAAKAIAKAASSPPTKKRKTSSSTTTRAKRKAASTEKLDAYHFIGYVPAHGRVWELDGLRAAGPLDVGEVQSEFWGDLDSRAGWMDVVRPALQRRMQSVLEGGSGEGHIQYNLLAIVDDPYLGASDDLELLKRERAALERRLGECFPAGWEDKVDPALLAAATEAFATTLRPSAREPGRAFAADFGARKMSKEVAILDMAQRNLVPAWESCVRAALSAKVAVEDEIAKSQSAQADNVKRTFDYEPFIREFVTSLQNEGLLEEALKGPPVQWVVETGEAASPKKSRTRKK
ncbi:cysteine proteinase [Lentinus tigrinus ALCF2SS1-7]|uniref:ubiquitinyl hydrolase 1 n=1 Tax=Lentinus tigrinus ALCF2SS1-6 TaxID=1328759 RepID=A0A5C2S3Y1_9APHY|nr:cysteine proteinase [Lentinus tigrinus ALCF2SS1-6]RPD72968.1 cysteine proteinase [Lentinus tigrinus ALCF2SS1-7]